VHRVNLVQSLKRLFQRPKVVRWPVLKFDQVGLFCEALPPIPWSSIVRITGYKVDLFTTDEVRFEIESASGNTLIISEESPGFRELVIELESRFPSLVGWHAKVAHPPFEPCTTVLYGAPNPPVQRDAASGRAADRKR
jgi:hypothetical protein